MSNGEKLAIVSGGTKGIGRATLEILAENGFAVATYARGEADLKALEADIDSKYNVPCLTMMLDGSNRKDVEIFANSLLDKGFIPEILVNNTGTFVPGTVLDEEEGAITSMIETNVYSAYYLTRIIGRQMRKNKRGHIFNICSTASITAYTNGGSYCISKHALLGFSKVLREELREHGVKVTSILPGATYTASWEGAELPQSRFMKAEDVAKTVYSAYSLSENTVIEEILLRPQLGDL